LTPYSITQASQLREQLNHVAQQGWAYTSQQYEVGNCGIAITLHGAPGGVLAALNVSFAATGDSQQHALEDFLPRMRLAALRIRQSAG
jgi:IclR family pca regulon transcriptional regulator